VPILRWECAHGDAWPVTLACARTVEIAPSDDSVDTNLVRIAGGGTIDWFGEGPPITKRVIFDPGVRLVHRPPAQTLLTEADRIITALSIGTYSCDGEGHWLEIHFTSTGAAEFSRRLDAIEQRLDRIERDSRR
jgi:hypothetical protein